jgi:PHS family inorganic phosphate transporter-like MFS transporter
MDGGEHKRDSLLFSHQIKIFTKGVRRRPYTMKKNTAIACVSNLSTAYNLVVINIVHVIIQNQYCGGDTCADAVATASTSCLVGAICGQLTFGYVGDCLGRSRAMQLTMALSIFGALLSAFAVPFSPSAPASIFYFLALTRFVLGVGVGGVYPLSATLASESAAAKSRGRTASIVFSMQGVGNVTVPLVALMLVTMCGNPPNLDEGGPSDLGLSWRLALGLGALPGIALAPFKASETRKRAPVDPHDKSNSTTPPTATSEAVDATLVAQQDARTLWAALRMRKYWGKLVGCAGGWLLFDITFYGNQLFQARVLHQIFNASHTGGPEPIEGDVHTNPAVQMLIVALLGLPGYYVSVYLMDSLGRRNIQLQGFFFMALTFGILGVWLAPLQRVPIVMLLLYGLTFFFSNFGPNSTTFILPAETFPPHLRSTLNGFSAACGKLGATIGSAAFVPLKSAVGLGPTMLVCAAISLLGLVATYAFVEDRRGKRMEGEGGEGGGQAEAQSRGAGGGGVELQVTPSPVHHEQALAAQPQAAHC